MSLKLAAFCSDPSDPSGASRTNTPTLRAVPESRAVMAAAAVAAAERLGVAESPAATELLDVKWRLACHHAAVERVFSQSALSAQSRRVYAMMEIEGLSAGEIAVRTGLAANAVRRIISRVRRMVAAVESELDV